MIFADILLAALLAVIFFFLFGALLGARRPGEGMGPEAFLLFMILFLVTWAGGTWFQPFGPALYGVTWLPFLLVALTVVLILAAARPIGWREPRTPTEAIEQERAEEVEAATFGVFFWILVGVTLIAAVSAYWI